MFRHPIRDLILLTAVGWYAKRSIDRRGGPGKVWSSVRSAAPFRRSRSLMDRIRR